MTSINALKLQYKDMDQVRDAIVFACDGMGMISPYTVTKEGIVHNPQGGQKGDDYQKIFFVPAIQGPGYLTQATGSADLILSVVNKVNETNYATVEDVVEKIMYNTRNLTPDIALNFIVGGQDDTGLAIYHVNCTGNRKHIDGTADSKYRNYEKKTLAIDGSGARFVQAYLEGCQGAGKPIIATDIADGLTLVYDLATRAARDNGVNDKMQFGIITPDTVSMLLHPDIKSTSMESSRSYIEHMCHVQLPAMGEEKDIDAWRALDSVLMVFYQALRFDLMVHSNRKQDYTHKAEGFRIGAVDLDKLQIVKQECETTKSYVQSAVNALLSRHVEGHLGYLAEWRSRQQEREKSALEFVRKD